MNGSPFLRGFDRFCFVLLVAAALQSARATAADPPDDQIKGQILGSLLFTRVDVRLHDRPSHEAFMMLGDAIGWTVLDYWSDESLGEAGRPDTRITLEARDVSAALALEMIIAQAAFADALTWQIGPGVIEVGTKSRLSERGSREQRLYDLNDLLASKPYFQSPDPVGGRRPLPNTDAFNRHSHRAAALYDGHMKAQYRGAAGEIRQSRGEIQRALVRGFVDFIEPGNWEFGDQLKNVLPADRRYRTHTQAETEHCIAQMRILKDGVLTVAAPDFMHRAMGGYPKPIAPDRGMIETPSSPSSPSSPPDADGEADFIRLVRVDTKSGAAMHPGGLPDPIRIEQSEMSDETDRGTVLSGMSSVEEVRTRLAKAIESRIVPVTLNAVPAREAFAQLSRKSGVPIIARFTEDGVPWGMPTDASITFAHDRLSLRAVIEALVSQCSEQAGFDCTWQIRPGFIEVGTKESLSADAARDLRVYNIRDLMWEAPTLGGGDRAEGKGRKPSEALGLDFVEAVVGAVEPEAWDWGQDPDEEESAFLEGYNKNLRPANPDPARPAVTSNVPIGAGRQYVAHYKPAIIRYWGDVVIIVAPDYIHRQIGGYGPQLK